MTIPLANLMLGLSIASLSALTMLYFVSTGLDVLLLLINLALGTLFSVAAVVTATRSRSTSRLRALSWVVAGIHTLLILTVASYLVIVGLPGID